MDRSSGVRVAAALIPPALTLFPWAATAPIAYLIAVRWRASGPVLRLGPWATAVIAAAAVATIAHATETNAWIGLGRTLAVASVLATAPRWVRRSDAVPMAVGASFALALVAAGSIVEVTLYNQPRASLSMFHPNLLGATMALLGVATVGWLAGIRTNSRWAELVVPRFGATVAAILAILAIVLTGSRTALLAAAVGAIVTAGLWPRGARRQRIWGRWAVFAGLLGFLALTVGLLSQTAASARWTALDTWFDPMGRPVVWGYALELIVASPLLGYGFASWQELATTVDPAVRTERITHVHNGYLEVVLGGGFLLFVALLAWLTAILRGLAKRARSGDPLGAVAVGTLTVFLTMNVAESYVAVEHLILLAALPAALAQSDVDDEP